MNTQKNQTLQGRKIYIPRMSYEGARTMASAFQSIGIDAEPLPEPDHRTIELGKKHTSGDECYPEQVTLGGCLKIVEKENFDPERTAFLMPTAGGPCRFGQYSGFLQKVLTELGYPGVLVFSPKSEDGYDQFGDAKGKEFIRIAWRAVVAADILRKLLLKTRPYEITKGTTDQVYHQSLDDICGALSQQIVSQKESMKRIGQSLERTRDRFRAIPAHYEKSKPLIGVVGEIYCRLDNFANEEVIRMIESQGGEAWMSDISEWVWYTNFVQQEKIRENRKSVIKKLIIAGLKQFIQRHDEHRMMELFQKDFLGYEEPDRVEEILKRSLPYLPFYGAIGEMTLNAGRTIYLYEKGADGVVDVSPFTCMNGIVSEAVYPKISKDHQDFPIKVFYFDGTHSDWDRDIGIYIELARNYQRKKIKKRIYPFPFA